MEGRFIIKKNVCAVNIFTSVYASRHYVYVFMRVDTIFMCLCE